MAAQTNRNVTNPLPQPAKRPVLSLPGANDKRQAEELAKKLDELERKAVLVKEQMAGLERANRDLRRRLGERSGKVPPRPWGDAMQPEAARGAPWWAVRRLGDTGSANHGPMFRHASLEAADREAEYLSGLYPGAVFVVLATVALHVQGEPEVKLREVDL